ncbi:homoserine O-acetyltransferase [Fibrobacter intestinalis]|uniref:Homoserine O-acetyltransferase n=2 Tax=Fibrobacteraceae TaxID=204431 RepID=A0A1M6X5W1_9BACT|nr:homoserine O-acetyltransferase [Fibrobacter sp. UWS1]PBC75243.1 homoserine O-acetyltransferase [Fibrobacter sp. NR9]SHL01422.1 homoserine O-acetyltransferase [Fibrobacter intestinalis]SKA03813.1 homoserine O-acetyltransferase [Fibrobacter intestinalis]
MRMSESLHKDSIGPVSVHDQKLPLGPEGFILESGKSLPEVSIRYETYGTLNPDKSNVIWICSPLTADAHVAGFYNPDDKHVGWWDALIGKGKAVDTDKFFVVCSNILGGCKGSTGPASIDPRTGKPYGSTFPTITIGDMVKAQKLLADTLGIQSFYCIIGGSMGGFQAMKWAIYYPEIIDRVVLIATSPGFSAQALGFEIVGRDVITQDPNYNNGDYYDKQIPATGLSNARKLAHITYLSAKGMESRFTRSDIRIEHPEKFYSGSSLETYLEHQGSKFVDRFDANSYLHIAHATDTFDLATEYGSLENAFKNVKATFLNVNLSSDWLFPPNESRKITEALLNAGKVVTSLELDTNFGHDGFLIECGALGMAISRFLGGHIGEIQATGTPAFHSEKDISIIDALIPAKASILDLGAGDGLLIDTLWKKKKVTGVGVEKNFANILRCIERDVPVIEKKLNLKALESFADNSFDYAVFNRTLPEVRNQRLILREIMRIAKHAIITFPNFGSWEMRWALCYHGRMPKSPEFPYEWYETPNIHCFTYRDFVRLAEAEKLEIEKIVTVNEHSLSKWLTGMGLVNLGAERVVAMVKKA